MSTDIASALATRRRRADELARRDARIANLRLTLAGTALVSAVLCLGGNQSWLMVAGAAAIGFAAIALHHAGVILAHGEAKAAVRYFERLAELAEDAGALTRSAGAAFTDIDDPTHGDLDLVGPGSVLDLLSTARTLPGRTLAARWLLHSSPAPELRDRQEAARELAADEAFREALWIAGFEAGRTMDPATVREWAGQPPVSAGLRRARLPALLLTTATLVFIVAVAAELPWGRYALELTVLLHLAFYAWTRVRAAPVLAPLKKAATTLEAYRRLIDRIEAQSLHAPRLAKLRATLAPDSPDRASLGIRQLRRLAEFVESAANPFVAAFLAPLGFLELHAALALDRWRTQNAAHVPAWLDTVAEVEALAGFGALAATRSAMVFPDIGEGPARFESDGLAHPLIAATVRVGNDVRLNDERRLILVSGSNMSGKSTLLRFVGVATRMALAGAPVCAHKLVITPLALRSSIRVADSLADSSSHFHQEVLRLKESLDATTTDPPLLYLFDEILHGTNSRERAIGARAIVRHLVEAGALGLVTTHDLAVTELADELGTIAENVHFSDHVEDGRMVFDYRMHPGVVRTTNAIRLMRQVGIELPFEDPA